MVRKIIRYLHINSKYKGYPLIIDAVNLYIENYGKCIKITKDINQILAAKYNTSITSVERNIRTVVEICWNNDRQTVETILGYKTTKCPSNSEFLDAVANIIINHYEIENDLQYKNIFNTYT